MADIKIYGTLKNDTDEPIALASQIYDDTNKEYLDAPLGRIKPDLVKVTWAQLKALRDASGLVPGCWYRITDYTCTTTQEETQSAGNVYDILVLATDTGSLSEQARAIRHEGDTYFAKSNLDAWQVWYCLDNDAHRFLWADTTNGKGVVYRLIDEFGNDCPYDFKSIQFKRYCVYYVVDDCDMYIDSTMLGSASMVDNIERINVDTSDFVYAYTMNRFADANDTGYESNTSLDCSLNDIETVHSEQGYHQDRICRNNIIRPLVQTVLLDDTSYNLQSLNNIVLFGGRDIDELDAPGCIKADMPVSISFGLNCSDISVDHGCASISFGDDCTNNIIGMICKYNTFGNACKGNILGLSCNYNSFGNYCENNTFDDKSDWNTLTNYVAGCFLYNAESNFLHSSNKITLIHGDNNSFTSSTDIILNQCYRNSFAEYCADIKLSDSNCNTFGSECQYIYGAGHCKYNSFGNGCKYITLGYATGVYPDHTTHLQSNYTNCRFDDGVSNLYLGLPDKPDIYATKIKNIHIHRGVKGGESTNNRITITPPVTDQNYEINYSMDPDGNIIQWTT